MSTLKVTSKENKSRLEFVLGRSGSGKSEVIIERICGLLNHCRAADGCYPTQTKSGKSDSAFEIPNIYLIVPEQFSFESERAILQRLGSRMSSAVKVWSFTRMAEGVFREVGGVSGRRIDEATRALLVSKALTESADWLKIYGKSALYADTVTSVAAMITELKTCGISDRVLEKALERLPDNVLKMKVEDISLLMTAYDTMLSRSANTGEDSKMVRYIDPLDELTLLGEKIKDSTLFNHSQIFIDSFKGFTGQEFKIIEALMKKAGGVTIALTTDSLYDKLGGFGLFAPVIETAEILRGIARENSIDIASSTLLEDNHRAKSDVLKQVEKNIFSVEKPDNAPDESGESLCDLVIAECTDIYDECDFVARDIRRRVREQAKAEQSSGVLRYRDVAVVARDIESYRGILDVALEKQEIAYNLDDRVDIRTEPLIALVMSALDAVNSSFNSDDMIGIMKTGLSGFTTASISLVENYTFMWQVNHSRWLSRWTGSPDGLMAGGSSAKIAQSSEDKMNGDIFSSMGSLDNEKEIKAEKTLWYLNLLRRRLVKNVSKLSRRLKPSEDENGNRLITGEVFAKAIYDYLINSRCDKIVAVRKKGLERTGHPELSERLTAIWDVCMVMLDRFATVFQHDKGDLAYFSSMFRVMAESVDLGEVPHSLDAVQLGSADRIRFSSPKIVYLIGANEGIFPAYPSGGGLFSDKERRELIASELPLSSTFEKKALEERFIAYQVISAPSEKLIVSYLKSDQEGGEAQPSIIIDSLTAIAPACERISRSGELVESTKDFIEASAMLWKAAGEPACTYKSVLESEAEENGELSKFKTRLSGIARGINWRFNESGNAGRLFGKNLTISPSMTELYHQCKFAYFCRYGLGAKPIRVAELDSLAFGTLAHHVMEKLLPRYIEEGLATVEKAAAHSDTRSLIISYIEENLGGFEDKSAKFIMLSEKLIRVVGALVWQVVLELSQSEFIPVDYELEINFDENESAVPPLTLNVDGGTVKVIGKIDRVDILKKHGQSYLRVVDYKTGAKDFKLSDVTEGINMQMLVYLSTLWENGQKRYGEVVPAGMLYLPAVLPVADVSEDNDKLEKAQIKKMKMNGLLLDDPEIISAMQTPENNGVFIPAALKNDGSFTAASSVASLEQFGILKQKAEALIKDMAATLLAGEIPAIPISRPDSSTACDWCDFKIICGRNSDDPTKFIAKKTLGESLSELDTLDEPKENGGVDDSILQSRGGEPLGS